mmetsp:Transcript_45496/g.75942  ORF Transcript_45496/g.75942 Transcript_45496/m.75942 type:complete len:254 (-) Transcript_45496:373-1134(-)
MPRGNVRRRKRQEQFDEALEEVPAEVTPEVDGVVGDEEPNVAAEGEEEIGEGNVLDDAEDTAEETEGTAEETEDTAEETEGTAEETEETGEENDRVPDLPTKSRMPKSPRLVSGKKGKGGFPWGTTIFVLFFVGVIFMKYFEDNYHITMESYAKNFDILQLDEKTTAQADVKKQYRAMSLKWHPDKNPGCGRPCQDKFTELERAHRELMDPDMWDWYQEMKKTPATTENKMRFYSPPENVGRPQRRPRASSKD